jgi:hypothetical protein
VDVNLEAANILLGDDAVAPTATKTAKADRRYTVGSAVDGTIYAAAGAIKARPATLAGAIADDLRAKGPATVSQMVDRLNEDGVYERVAYKSATLRPYSSVAYWLKTWAKAGLVVTLTADQVVAVEEVAVDATEVA